ncbi:putative spermidine/putrescine transport system ATP-binding protein [Agreia bicolorata]|uniref:Putative spermidine/putrescine transport system ATP-binding protein n=1 Tax=Agreia bicolorata TaxID=110935 RepID=A0A1T4WPN1_9MICO|nr:ABC transporter ATP-binding protein [Agreia bicolorata]SKA79209.1 putative spermidine/putrescine transport system ATP-binding protein [Agreia bicolorata]
MTPLTKTETPSGLTVTALTKVLSNRTIVENFELDVAAGELVALLGPSGCGKTTTLRMMAGFLEPDTGSVSIGGVDVTDKGPDKRPSAMVFQNYALWPHLTVFKNVAFPLSIKRVPRAEITQRVMAALETVNLAHHAHSRPAHISGGEQQRAALARAIVQRPDLLLLDEPLSNLDAKLRVKVREEIRDIQQRLGITTVMVTHDQDEAMAISDRVAVMNAGRIEQVSTPTELYANPRTLFVASFIGSMNVLPAPTLFESASLSIVADAAADAAPDATPAEAWAVRPEDVLFEPASGVQRPGATPVEVRRVLPHGHFSELVLSAGGTEVRSVAGGTPPAVGDHGTVTLNNVRHYVDGILAGGRA